MLTPQGLMSLHLLKHSPLLIMLVFIRGNYEDKPVDVALSLFSL